MGNTLGAMVFLAAATYLGWTIVRGRAQSFLAAASGGAGGGSGGAGASPPATVHGGPLAGIPTGGFPFAQTPAQALQSAPTPTVMGDVFGQNGNLNAPQYESPYSPSQWTDSNSGWFLGPWSWLP